ncbi:MAG: hypothetical protein FJ398_26000 [Verrucomicrobia bacterium]|nr:hypothetical protein [Verrucomicrobiota bacterium]MBM3960203.1 hypothetical protein [SAR202 cluster bacterium]
MDEELQQILKHLRLGSLLANWDELLGEARRGRFSHERLLKHVLQAEYRAKGEQALDRGHRGYFISFPELVAKLYASLADHSQDKLLRKFSSYDCLVIDEVGYAEVEPTQVGLFFTLMQKRHKTKTTLITSNLGFSEWGSFLKNKHLASALFDRLSATTHVFNMKDCVSLRPKLNDGGESDAA